MKQVGLLPLLFVLLCLSQSSIAQQSVGIGTNTPNPNAVLQLVSPGQNQGFLLPKLTTAQITTLGGTLGTADIGLQVYDSVLQQIRYWNGAAWLTINTSSSVGTVTSVGLTLPGIFNVSGSPVTTSGILNATLANQAQNTFFAGPTTGSAAPTFRSLVAGDIPVLDAAVIASGTFPITRGGTNGVAVPTAGAVAYGTGTAYAFTSAGISGQVLQSNGAGVPTWVNLPAAGWGLAGNLLSGGEKLGSSNGNPLTLITNNTDRMTIDVNGNVGIGIAAPLTRLHVFQPLNQATFFETDATVQAQNYIEFSTGRYNGNTNRLDAKWQVGLNQNPAPSANDFFGIGRNNIGYDFVVNREGSVGIGTMNPQERLDIIGNLRFSQALMPNGVAGSAGEVLTSQGPGVAPVWSPAGGSGWGLTGNAGTIPAANFIGTTDAQDLVFRTQNSERMRISQAGNIGIGTTTPLSALTIASGNVEVSSGSVTSSADSRFNDVRVGQGFTIGQQNTAVGIQSQQSSTGINNTSFGFFTLYGTTGSNNVAVGINAMRLSPSGSDNTGIGDRALQAIASGSNTGIGAQALKNTDAGSNNTSLGAFTGLTNVTGNQNTLIGANADVLVNNLNNATAIGYNAKVGASNTLVLGGIGVDAVNVGIGTTTPSQRLHVDGNIRFSGALMPNNQAGTAGQVLQSNGAGAPTWATLPSFLSSSLNNGSILIGNAGNTATAQTLSGDATLTNTGTLTIANNAVNSAKILDGTITNADVNAAAAIAGTKVNPNFGTTPDIIGGTLSLKTFSPVTSQGLYLQWNRTGFQGESWILNQRGTGGADAGIRFGDVTTSDVVTEWMRIIQNGNVGIGTTSPSERLHVNGNIRFSGALMPNNTAGTAGQVLTSAGAGLPPTWAPAGGSGWGLTGNAGTNPATNFIGTTDAQPLRFATGVGGVERMRIDATGNVGLGTSTPFNQLSLVRSVAPTGDQDEGSFIDIQNSIGTPNALSGLRFKVNTATANQRFNAGFFYRLNSSGLGELNFAIKSNTTANISASDIKMTISESGNVGIGTGTTTSPSLSLDVVSSSGLGVRSSTATWDHLFFRSDDVTSTITAGGADEGLRFRVGVGITGSYGDQPYTTVATMMPNGNVGIGTTTPNAPLQFSNTLANRKVVLFENSNNDHRFRGFGTNLNILRYQVEATTVDHVFYAAASNSSSNELMRITGTGNVGVGINPSARFHIKASGTSISDGIRIETSLGSSDDWYIYMNPSNDLVFRDDSEDFIICQNTTNRIGLRRTPTANTLEVNGSASKTTAGDWLANSDARIKKEVTTIENAIDKVMQLRPVRYKYTEQYIGIYPFIEDRYYHGFIAQEYQKVFPDVVKSSGESLPGDASPILQIDPFDAQIVTIKAVQEQQSQIEALKKEIEELKALLRKD